MASIYLDDFIANSDFYLKRFIPRLINFRLDWKGIQEMTTAFRQRGVCSLLLYGVAKDFFINMMQSAGAFLHYLQRCSEEDKITSHCKPFFDAIGGGYWDCASAIARNSRMTWNQGYEYEEDFLYVKFLMSYFFLAADRSEIELIIQRFDDVQGGAEEERSEDLRSFSER